MASASHIFGQKYVMFLAIFSKRFYHVTMKLGLQAYQRYFHVYVNHDFWSLFYPEKGQNRGFFCHFHKKGFTVRPWNLVYRHVGDTWRCMYIMVPKAMILKWQQILLGHQASCLASSHYLIRLWFIANWTFKGTQSRDISHLKEHSPGIIQSHYNNYHSIKCFSKCLWNGDLNVLRWACFMSACISATPTLSHYEALILPILYCITYS